MSNHGEYVARVARETGRARIAQARAALKEARAQKRTATKRARMVCTSMRALVRASIERMRADLKEEIARLRARVRDEVDKKRARVRECCGPQRQRVRARHDARIAEARAELEELIANRHTWASLDQKTATRRQRGKERAQERDSLVELNLSPDELTVWHRVKRQIKAGPRMSRLEAFQHWAHENPGEVTRILEQDAERQLREAIKNEEKERRQYAEIRKVMRKKPERAAAYVREHMQAVPF